jgi:hypothetical protein
MAKPALIAAAGFAPDYARLGCFCLNLQIP